jgi:hypothetical protein
MSEIKVFVKYFYKGAGCAGQAAGNGICGQTEQRCGKFVINIFYYFLRKREARVRGTITEFG